MPEHETCEVQALTIIILFFLSKNIMKHYEK